MKAFKRLAGAVCALGCVSALAGGFTSAMSPPGLHLGEGVTMNLPLIVAVKTEPEFVKTNVLKLLLGEPL